MTEVIMRLTTLYRSISHCLDSIASNPDVLELIGDPVWYNCSRCTKVYHTPDSPPAGSVAVISLTEPHHRFSVTHSDDLYFAGKQYDNVALLMVGISEMYDRGELQSVLPSFRCEEEHTAHVLTLATFIKFWQRPRVRAELFFTLDFEIVATGADITWASGLRGIHNNIIVSHERTPFYGKNIYGGICELIRSKMHHIGMF